MDQQPKKEVSSEYYQSKKAELGSKLKALRESHRLSLQDVVHLTRISPNFITALEEGAFEKLPGKVFGRGFIRNICQITHEDSSPLLADYDGCWPSDDQKKRTNLKSNAITTLMRSKKSHLVTNHLGSKTNPKKSAPVGIWVFLALVAVFIGIKTLLVENKMPQTELSQTEETTKETTADSPVSHEAIPNPEKTTTAPTQEIKTEKADASQPEITNDTQKAAEKQADTYTRIEGTGDTFVELESFGQAKVEFRLDSNETKTEVFSTGKYRFNFSKKSEFYIFDTSLIRLQYNGHLVSDRSEKSEERRFVFNNKNIDAEPIATSDTTSPEKI